MVMISVPRVARFQGVHLLENKGGLQFNARQIGMLPGVQDFDVLDVDQDGDRCVGHLKLAGHRRKDDQA